MNRADRLYSVLRDGRKHSRQEIFDAVGYMLTNNAASELRARGHDVRHLVERRLDVYWIPPASVSSVGLSAESSSAPRGLGELERDETEETVEDLRQRPLFNVAA